MPRYAEGRGERRRVSCAYHARLKSPLSSKKDAEATEVLRTWKKMSLRTIDSSLCACVVEGMST